MAYDAGMAYDEALAERIRDRLRDAVGVRPFDMTGRPMRGWILVAGEALDDAELARWIDQASRYVATLPVK
jgi:hypothetical protein